MVGRSSPTHGTVSIGEGARLSSRPVQSHLVVGTSGLLEIGERVSISYGAAISRNARVRIGDDTAIGPFVVIMDSDFHVVGDRTAHGEPRPIRIGRGVVIEARVTILRGATVGDGARVRSGSVVSGQIPASTVVGGVPARAATETLADEELDLPNLVMKVLNLGGATQLGRRARADPAVGTRLVPSSFCSPSSRPLV